MNQLLAAPVVIEEGKAYVGGKGVSNTGGGILDFLLRQAVLENVVLLEIKTPTTPLLGSEYRAGVFGPSDDLGGGITQLANYRQSLLNEFNALGQGQPFEAFNPGVVLLIGSVERELGDRDRRRSFELFRTGLSDVDVVTYDELFARARALRELLAATSTEADSPADS